MAVRLSHRWLTFASYLCACRTSLYDARARERRRLIEEQEALASQLLHQVSLHLLLPVLVTVFAPSLFSSSLPCFVFVNNALAAFRRGMG